MPTSSHYRINAQGKRVYLSSNPELATAQNFTQAVDRLAASLGSPQRPVLYYTCTLVPNQDDIQDRTSKLLVGLLASAMLGLVGLVVGALVPL